MKLRKTKVTFAVLFGVAAWWYVIWCIFGPTNQLARYGVYFEDVDGYPVSDTFIKCFWKKGDRLITGPRLRATGLYITFKDLDHDGIPEIVARSSDESYSVTFRLNFADSTKPDFELLERHGSIGIQYPQAGLHSD